MTEYNRGETEVIQTVDESPYVPESDIPDVEVPETPSEEENMETGTDTQEIKENASEEATDAPINETDDEEKSLDESEDVIEDNEQEVVEEPVDTTESTVDSSDEEVSVKEQDVEAITSTEEELEETHSEVDVKKTRQLVLEALRKKMDVKMGVKKPIGWDEAECKAYLNDKVWPAMTSRYNVIHDAYREKDIQSWDDSEIKDFLANEITVSDSVIDSVWEMIYLRYRLPGSWSLETAKEFILNGKTPEQTVSGLLVNDRQRATKTIDQLTFTEVKAALLGEIELPFNRNDLLKQILKYTKLSERMTEAKLLDALQTTELKDMADTILLTKLEEYKVARTKGSRPDPKLVGDAHAMFYRVIKKLIARTEFTSFKEGWNTLLDFVRREENTIFSPKNRYIHFDHVPLKGTELSNLENVIALLTMTCDPVSRNVGVDASIVLSMVRNLGNEAEVNNIVNFYSK